MQIPTRRLGVTVAAFTVASIVGMLSTARIVVRLDDAFGAFEARQRYHADLRLLARTDHVDPVERVILFDGYPSAQETEWDARGQRGQWTFGFKAEHAYARLARLREPLRASPR